MPPIFPIIVLGVFGVISRYGLSLFLVSRWPWDTFIINLIGSFLIGLVYVLAEEKGMLDPSLRLGIMVGFLGGFTTFSSYSLDTMKLLEQGSFIRALSYWLASPLFGFILCYIGMTVGRKVF